MTNLEARSDSGSVSLIAPQHQRLEILCGCDGSYFPHAAAMLCSLVEHNQDCRIHLFYSSVRRNDLVKLKSLIASYRSEVVCYEMVPEHFSDLRVDKWKAHSSIANYFRLLAPRTLPTDIDKILYLDCDIIVRHPLDSLWNVDVSNHALAAVECSFWDPGSDFFVKLPPGARYFNSGVLLINLNYWREYKICELSLDFVRKHPEMANLYDQDALNAVLVNSWIPLPAVWNEQARSTLDRPALRDQNTLDPAIVHFVSSDKPWHRSCSHPFRHEYHRYRRKTPWRHYRLQRKGKRRLMQTIGTYMRSGVRLILPKGIRQRLRAFIFVSGRRYRV